MTLFLSGYIQPNGMLELQWKNIVSAYSGGGSIAVITDYLGPLIADLVVFLFLSGAADARTIRIQGR